MRPQGRGVSITDVMRQQGRGVSIQTGNQVQGRFNEPSFKTIAVENKLFDVKQMKADSAKSAKARRMDLLKGNQLITIGRIDSYDASRMSVDTNMFSAPGLFKAVQTKGIRNTIRDRASPNTISVDTSFLPVRSQDIGSGIYAVQTDGPFLGSSLGSDNSRVSLSPSTKFHDQSSLLAMVSDQISIRRHQTTIPVPGPTATIFTRKPTFPVSRMPFTGPASAWDIRPRLPNTLDLIIPPHPTIAPSSGRVDIPPPPVHLVHSIPREGTFSTPRRGHHLLTDMPFDEFRPHMTQKTVTVPTPRFDPLSGTGFVDITVSQPRVDIFTANPHPFISDTATNNAVFTTIPPPPPPPSPPSPPSPRFNSGFHRGSIVQPVINRLHHDVTLQTATVPNNADFVGSSAIQVQDHSFLYDPIAPPSQVYRDMSVDIGPPPPFDTIPWANPDIMQPAVNAFDPALDLTNTFDQSTGMNIPSVSSTEASGPATFATINIFDQRSNHKQSPVIPTTPTSVHPKLDRINTFDQPPRMSEPPAPPTQPPITVYPSSDITTAETRIEHAVDSPAYNASSFNNSESPVIQYDMTPFYNNENWAIFDPTSLPPGVNFSDFGPIIDLPMDSPVSFTSTNEIGFQNMFSQDVPPRDAGSLTVNITNKRSTAGIGDNTVVDMNAGIMEKPFIHTVEVIPAGKTASNKIHTETLKTSSEHRRNMQTGKQKQNIDPPAEITIVGNEQTHVNIYTLGHRENMAIPPLNDTRIQYKDVRSVNSKYDSVGAGDVQYDGLGAVNEHIAGSDVRLNSSPQAAVDIPPPPPI